LNFSGIFVFLYSFVFVRSISIIARAFIPCFEFFGFLNGPIGSYLYLSPCENCGNWEFPLSSHTDVTVWSMSRPSCALCSCMIW